MAWRRDAMHVSAESIVGLPPIVYARDPHLGALLIGCVLHTYHAVPLLRQPRRCNGVLHRVLSRQDVCGTVWYYAPELVAFDPYQPVVDEWALGVRTRGVTAT